MPTQLLHLVSQSLLCSLCSEWGAICCNSLYWSKLYWSCTQLVFWYCHIGINILATFWQPENISTASDSLVAFNALCLISCAIGLGQSLLGKHMVHIKRQQSILWCFIWWFIWCFKRKTSIPFWDNIITTAGTRTSLTWIHLLWEWVIPSIPESITLYYRALEQSSVKQLTLQD